MVIVAVLVLWSASPLLSYILHHYCPTSFTIKQVNVGSGLSTVDKEALVTVMLVVVVMVMIIKKSDCYNKCGSEFTGHEGLKHQKIQNTQEIKRTLLIGQNRTKRAHF